MLGRAASSCATTPTPEDIEKARQSDPNDHSWVWWEFNVENRGDAKCKIRLWVEVLDKNGKVIKQSDRSDTVDAHKLDDDIRRLDPHEDDRHRRRAEGAPARRDRTEVTAGETPDRSMPA